MRPRTAMVGLLVGVQGTTGLVGAQMANAAVPTFPDNLVAFPNRDLVVVGGYTARKGETATAAITRPSLGIASWVRPRAPCPAATSP